MNTTSIHLVVVPLPAQGHLSPMIYLSRRLAAQGFTITLINVDTIHSVLEKTWKNLPGQDIRLESVPMEVRIPEVGFNSDCMNYVTAFLDALTNLENPLAALLTRLKSQEGGTLRCVISDFFHDAAPLAASKVGVESVCFWSGAASWASIEYNVPSLVSHGYIPVDERNGDEVIGHLPGLEPIKASDLPLYMHEKMYANFGNERSVSRFKRVKLDRWVLVHSVYEFEQEVFDAMEEFVPGRFVAIGPLFPLDSRQNSGMNIEVSLRAQDSDALQWLDRQAPQSVLYVSFGSVSALTFEEFEELASGLEASGTGFLFVIPENLVLDMQEVFYHAFVKRNRDVGLVVRWAPQLAVLQHESVGGFLTHCGWNSILESLCAGVPMLGWPCTSEQNTNCKLILERRGVGLGIENKTRRGVENSIRSLMHGSHGDKLRKKTMEFQELARVATTPGGSSLNNVNLFVNFVKQY